MIAANALDALRDRDPSLAAVLAAIVRTADANGAVPFRSMVLGYRETWLEAGGTLAEMGEPVPDLDPVREHLSQSALPRLAAEGWLEDTRGDRWDEIRVAGDWWEDAVHDRTDTAAVLVGFARSQLRQRTPTATPAAVPAARGTVLEGIRLTKSFKKRKVVNDVTVRVEQGEIVGLLGPNGAGKTTTFYCITGLIRPDAGEIRLGDVDLTGRPMYQRARAGIGYLAQEPSIFRKLTVEENIMAILETQKLSRKERKDRLDALLDELSIKHLRKSKAYSLSGGERRRLEITRALVTEPRFMLLDEPFAGVDPIAVHDIQTIVAGLTQRNIGVLITDHNVEQTLDIVDRAYIMFEGRVQAAGSVRELVYDDDVAQKYLGPTLTARLRSRLENPA